MHSLTEDDPDNEFRTSNDTNLSTWPLHSFSAFNTEWRITLRSLLLLAGLAVGQNSIDPCVELWVQHYIKLMMITGTLSDFKKCDSKVLQNISIHHHFNSAISKALTRNVNCLYMIAMHKLLVTTSVLHYTILCLFGPHSLHWWLPRPVTKQ
jgi:hypothetical protein